ncbi:cell division control protein [Aureobasidium sp. EXF-10728]|nr:cell division control protein [Aureobasidium sp. EXF-10728]
MSASVLGKRTRSSTNASDSGIQTRAKRRETLVLGNDENDNPFFKPNSSPATTQPKHTPSKRVVSSPNKISAHFSVSKTTKASAVAKSSPLATPQTPRHRDALSSKVTITPRHRHLITSSPDTPRSPCTPSNAANNIYNQARQIFSRCTDPGVLVGREEEKEQLSAFISERLDSSEGGCLYISGPPGTGKSAFVGQVCQDIATKSDRKMIISTVNCMSVKTAKDLANTLSKDLDLNSLSGRGADFEFLRDNFFQQERNYVVILDEIDRLVDLDLKLLYSLFEWSMEPSSSLILIGIANALDLTDRFLPRLKSRNLKPNLLPFMPYTAPQIANIITSKLKGLDSSLADPNFIPFLHPAAIQFCSKKVAAQTGDLRKAFDICRRAVDMIESETKVEQARIRLQDSPSKTPLKENLNLASPAVKLTAFQKSALKDPRQTTLFPSISHLTLETAPRATIAHVAKVTAAVFSNGASQRLASLNLQQKAVLCALSALEKKKREAPSVVTFPMTPSKHANSAPTVKQLYEAYCTLCNQENLLHALTSIEFRDVVSGLETLSLISAVEAKGTSSFSMPLTPSRTPSRRSKSGFTGAAMGDDRRMAACVGHAELVSALKGPGSDILKEMIEGDGIVA